MAQLEFPLNQLGEQLKCTDCRNHLSAPPVVVLKDTGQYKCGRCSLTGQDRTGECRTHPKVLAYQTAVRDLPYEQLARDLLFPCKNRKYGCEANEKFQHLADAHETHCSVHHNSFMCPMRSCEFRYCGLDNIANHFRSKHPAEICAKKWHSHVFAIPKASKGISDRVFFSSDDEITFYLVIAKTGREFTFTLRSIGTNRLFQFEIKPGRFRNNRRKGESLLSDPAPNGGVPVKLVLQTDDEDSEEAAEYEFQVDFVGKAKQEELMVEVPVEGRDVVNKCAKCHKYLSVKPVMATKNGFECGRCFKRTGGSDAVRMKAYEVLAEMVVFPCEEPGCRKSFGFGEMKKHWDVHVSPENNK